MASRFPCEDFLARLTNFRAKISCQDSQVYLSRLPLKADTFPCQKSMPRLHIFPVKTSSFPAKSPKFLCSKVVRLPAKTGKSIHFPVKTPTFPVKTLAFPGEDSLVSQSRLPSFPVKTI
ncbi:hypothetical protein BaRGS_00008574 [Batillaria attramentaria]|uniref:Uncharacterized protein n=1 Tax=Batillaria attramentaria TaxID=370345 RepID=A0ABD0LKF2_9CAEN